MQTISLPNLVTLARILLVPLFALAYLLPLTHAGRLAAFLFALAAFSDWLDGYLARRLAQTTAFGTFLDPVADKLIVVTALTLLVGKYADLWMTMPAIVIISREVLISALREWMKAVDQSGLVRVRVMGKVKTALQMLAIILLLAHPPNPDLPPAVLMGYGLLYAATLMTLWSMCVYLRVAWPELSQGFRLRKQG